MSTSDNNKTGELVAKLATIGVTVGAELIRNYLDAKALHPGMTNEEFIIELQRMQDESERRAAEAGKLIRDTD